VPGSGLSFTARSEIASLDFTHQLASNGEEISFVRPTLDPTLARSDLIILELPKQVIFDVGHWPTGRIMHSTAKSSPAELPKN
jgi:hypothetical protein